MFSGILVWTLLVDPGSHRRLSVGGRVALAAAMFAAGQVLTDVLVFTFHAALSGVPRRLRVLGAHRPAARGDRDDGRAAPHARHVRRAAAAPRWAAPAGLAWPQRRERDALQLRAGLSRARRSPPPRSTGGRRATTGRRRWRVVAFGSGLFLIAASLNSPLETIAAQLPPARAPAPERADRRHRAAARPARADAGDAAMARPPRPATGSARARSSPSGSSRGTGRTSPAFYDWALRTGWALNIEHAILIAAASSSGGRSSAAGSRRRRRSRISAPASSARRSSASRSSSRAGRSTRSTSTRRGSGACRRCATRTSAGS